MAHSGFPSTRTKSATSPNVFMTNSTNSALSNTKSSIYRLFFEKSRLSVSDLRKIWQLSDINKDGLLTLEEFSIAMHLIVLRRNNIPVPETLPTCLVPRVDSRFSQRAITTDLVDLGADMFGSGTSADFNFAPKEATDLYEAKPTVKSDERKPSLTPPKLDSQANNREWTKFVDSPTSSVSSPGPKPVNFDFQRAAVERDPKIFHPVAMRVTPDASSIPLDEQRVATSPRRDDISHAFELASPKRLHSQPPPDPPPNGQEIRAISRPQPRKPIKSAGVLPPPPARDPIPYDDGPQSLQLAPRKEPPPPPPPRPIRNHARSSSLDLTRLKGPPPTNIPNTAPVPPPRTSPGNGGASGEYEAEGFGYNREDATRARGAFEVVVRRVPEPAVDVRALMEQNAVLHRVCRALCAELADVQREREGLRVRLSEESQL